MTVALAPLHARYLRVLGLSLRPAGLDGLRDVVASHIRRVPFENVSKLLLLRQEGRGRVTALGEFLDGIEYHDLGGTCYTSNPFLAELLAALGYDASLVGADMSAPNVHTCVRVRLDGVDYHVDAGYAAPFVEPMRLDHLPRVIEWGHNRYVLEPSADGYRMSVFTNGQHRHGYHVHPPSRPASFFHPVVIGSFEPGRTFLRCLRITRHFDGYSVELRNRRLLRFTAGGVTERTVDSLSDLRRSIDEDFQMPRCRIEDAVATLEAINGRDFFSAEAWRDSTD